MAPKTKTRAKTDNGWPEYKREVVSTLEEHSERIDKLEGCVNRGFTEVKVEIAKLSVRSGVAMFVGGAVVVAVVTGVVTLLIGG